MTKQPEKCKGEHEYYIVRYYYHKERNYNYSTSMALSKPNTHYVVILCKKCGELKVASVEN